MSSKPHLATQLVHAGRDPESSAGAAQLPIFRSTVHQVSPGQSYEEIRYPRLSNMPNHREVEAIIAAAEGAEAAAVAASGMAAISATILSTLKPGGHILIQAPLYGGTHSLARENLPQWGMSVSFIDASRPESWKDALTKNTQAIYSEAISNPLMEVADHQAIVDFAKEHGLTSLIDATFATPVNFRPLALGYDLVMHSATKYLNGHSDLVAGVTSGNQERIHEIRKLHGHLGGCLDPHGCFLLARGLRTLELRMPRHNDNGLALAQALAEIVGHDKVHYPGLESHAGHARAKELFAGFGGMLAFDAGSKERAEALMGDLKLAFPGPSLGGIETLVTRPAATSHVGVPAEERARIGVTEGLVRISTGIEHQDDLIADFTQALG